MRVPLGLAVMAAAALAGAACDGANAFTGTSFGVSGLGGTGFGTVSGQVSVAGTGRAGVGVVVLGVDSAVTDLNGFYQLDSIPVGQRTVVVRVPTGLALATGETGTRTVLITAGASVGANFSLVLTGTTP